MYVQRVRAVLSVCCISPPFRPPPQQACEPLACASLAAATLGSVWDSKHTADSHHRTHPTQPPLLADMLAPDHSCFSPNPHLPAPRTQQACVCCCPHIIAMQVVCSQQRQLSGCCAALRWPVPCLRSCMCCLSPPVGWGMTRLTTCWHSLDSRCADIYTGATCIYTFVVCACLCGLWMLWCDWCWQLLLTSLPCALPRLSRITSTTCRSACTARMYCLLCRSWTSGRAA